MADDVDPNLKANDAAEAEAKRLGDYALHPIVSKIQHKFGVFNVIRNARNTRQVAVNSVDNPDADVPKS